MVIRASRNNNGIPGTKENDQLAINLANYIQETCVGTRVIWDYDVDLARYNFLIERELDRTHFRFFCREIVNGKFRIEYEKRYEDGSL